MFQIVSEWWGWLVADGALLLALMIGILVSLGATQLIKKTFLCSRRFTRITAFIIGTAAAFMSAPAPTWRAFWLAVSAGLLAPTIYKGFSAFAKWRGWEWVEALSVDKS